MLSRLIDNAYYGLRYAIWGPEVPYSDGTYVAEGRPLEERSKASDEWAAIVHPSLARITEASIYDHERVND